MREETKRMGLDPDKWFSNVEIAAGKIVGRETVRYVANFSFDGRSNIYQVKTHHVIF
jgi:hypothetical protein